MIELDTKCFGETRTIDTSLFFSAYISGARRLPNGNTLVTEGHFGRIFQVTPAGAVVWEYINPHFAPNEQGYPVNSVFRATHYPPDAIPQLR